MIRSAVISACLLLLSMLAPVPLAQDGEEGDDGALEERVDALEDENRELRRRIDLLAEEQERFELGDVFPPVGESEYGLGPAASKIYAHEQGLSIGGYGEALFQDPTGGGPRRFDFLRAILYFGYRFSERWVFNSEIEFEHASTSEEGSASVEFAYLDYLWRDEAGFRIGLLLVPMGFLNELHEPPTFLGATRPETERRLIPSTWRENGAGVFGDAGPFSYRLYALNGLDATGFSSSGLRGGRQKGSEALAEDVALVGRLDWTETPGLLAGVSAYHGGSGHDQMGLGDTDTTIFEAHAEWRWRGLWTRGLYAMGELDDVAELNAAQGFVGDESVGEELAGWYAEVGYDVMPLLSEDTRMALYPYVRYEELDTQEEVPAGFASSASSETEVVTVGLHFRPIPQVVFKLDYQDFDRGPDRWNGVVGYIF